MRYLKNAVLDFPDFWHEVKNRYEEQSDRAGFPKKNPVRREIHENRSKYRFFALFSETALTILLIFSQNLETNDMNDDWKYRPENIFRSPGNPRKPVKTEVFGENLRKYNTDFDNFWTESAKQTFWAAKENRTSIPFQLPEIFEPEDASGGTISCRPARKFTKKIFFRQTILNGPIREKNMFPEIRKIFALITWPWLDT
jgi:hypothetical protein